MITAERKPLDEILAYIKPFKRILLLGCNECVTVCAAGGRKEVGVLASGIQMSMLKNGASIEIREHTLERQCDPEYVEELVPIIDSADAVLSMACGCGVQQLATRFKDKPVFPAVNTKFMGGSDRHGVWTERCKGCGDCLLGVTGGICPIAKCAKQLMNGPCGGSVSGVCEIGDEVECAWHLIWERLKALGLTDQYLEIMPAKDWRPGGGSGPRKIVREDLAE
jgi:ferredoxin